MAWQPFSFLSFSFFGKCWVTFRGLNAPQFVYSFTWVLGCFQVLAIMNKGAVKHFYAGFFQLFVERSLSYDKNMFNFVRKYPNVFQSGCTILHPHQEWMKIPIAPCPHRHLVSSVLDCLHFWWHMTWSIFPCAYLLFYIFCDISFKIFGPLFNWIVLLLSFKISLYILDNSPLSDAPFAGIFS